MFDEVPVAPLASFECVGSFLPGRGNPVEVRPVEDGPRFPRRAHRPDVVPSQTCPSGQSAISLECGESMKRR